jgi:short-subunit dehydrogenase
MGKYPLDQSYLETVKDVATREGDIRVLINNAGMSHDIPVTFEDMDSVEMEGIMGVNTGGALRVTKAALPYILNDRYSPFYFGLTVVKRRD